jgi:hypothetical protein
MRIAFPFSGPSGFFFDNACLLPSHACLFNQAPQCDTLSLLVGLRELCALLVTCKTLTYLLCLYIPSSVMTTSGLFISFVVTASASHHALLPPFFVLLYFFLREKIYKYTIISGL